MRTAAGFGLAVDDKPSKVIARLIRKWLSGPLVCYLPSSPNSCSAAFMTGTLSSFPRCNSFPACSHFLARYHSRKSIVDLHLAPDFGRAQWEALVP